MIFGLSVTRIDGDRRGKAIVRAAIAMAKAMEMNIVAEGVETEQQMHFLIAEGCDMMQGFHFARPMPFADFLEYLRLQQSAPQGMPDDRAWPGRSVELSPLVLEP